MTGGPHSAAVHLRRRGGVWGGGGDVEGEVDGCALFPRLRTEYFFNVHSPACKSSLTAILSNAIGKRRRMALEGTTGKYHLYTKRQARFPEVPLRIVVASGYGANHHHNYI